MTVTTTLSSQPSAADHATFAAVGHLEHGCRVVHVSGELDIANREAMFDMCNCADSPVDVVVDLAGLTFMDCVGYSAFVSARCALMRQGRTLTLANASGEPAMLIALIKRVEIQTGQNAAGQNAVS
jgi:anti-anti-sigma factor